MPSAVTSRRRQRGSGSDDDEDSPDAPTPSTSGSSNKRARLNLNGNATPTSQRSPSPISNEPAAENYSQSMSLPERPSLKKHQPGSIVRVKLTDFVTYTAVEFFPGPSLNMVIGPNGTGKSTLVCAICLGLGWGAQHLGRAKEVSEYVKHGCQEATIELELAGDRQYPEVVVRCRITREGNKTAFYFNGGPASKKEIQKIARHFSIQIDNLCQFLPQDKVVEFAAMTPVELLRSTQRAVAPQEMLDMHEALKELRKQQRIIEAENASNKDTLSNLQARQRMQQADVERMRERNVIQERVKMLEKSRPIWHYRDAYTAYNDARDNSKDAERELRSLEKEVQPVLRAVNAKEAYQAQVEHVLKQRKLVASKAEKDADTIDRKVKDLHDRAQELKSEKNAESNSGRQSRSEVARIEGNIARLKKQMEEPPPDLDISSYNEQIRECSRAVDEFNEQGKDIQRKQTELTRRGREKRDQFVRAEKELKDLDSQAGQQLQKLNRIAPTSYRAWEWIRQNQDKFEKPIFGPPLLECSIKDSKWADQIESLFQKNQFVLFTAQTKNDFAKLSNIMDRDLRLADVSIRTVDYGLDKFPPPLPSHELQRYGLEGWALDYIDGPEPVVAMLAYELKLHVTAIGSRDTTPQQYDVLQNSPVESWVTNKSYYRIIRRREYGPSATSAQVRGIQRATMWTDQPVDITAKRDLEANIQGWTEEIEAFDQQISEMQRELNLIRDRIREKQKEQANLTKDKADKQKSMGEIKALPVKLVQQEEKLGVAQTSVDGVKARIQAIEDKIDAVTLEQGQAALDYATAVETVRKAHSDLYITALTNIEATSDVQTLIERNSAVKTLLQEKGKEVEVHNRTREAARKKSKDALTICKRLVEEANADPGYRAFMDTLSANATGVQMEEEISAEKARLELTHEGNGAVVKEYEQRERRVDALKATLEEGQAALDDSAEKIKDVRDKWEPELDKLVNKISRSFSFNMRQINCAGEVEVGKDESDFDAWSIRILVKFREHEPLTQLDSHRQSGGERAVSTIFYLMSLQSLTRSPFRVVDEINQGMDPRNERLVHKRMVNIACGTTPSEGDSFNNPNGDEDEQDEVGDGGGSQYFLITPKLLHGLEYARGMRVLCIASGEKMPTEKSKIDFGKCVDIARGLRGLPRMGTGRVNGVATAG